MNAASGTMAVLIAGAIIVAQVILPATFDLISSLGLFGVGAFCGWKAAGGKN